MSDELSNIDWDTLFEKKNVKETWNIFKSKLHNSMENHIPKRRYDNRFTNPPLWMDKNTKLAIINKRRAWRKYKSSRTRASYIDYALNRNSCTRTDSTLTNTDEEKVNTLNDYFTSVFTRTDDLNEDPDVKEMDTFLDNNDVTVDEVLKKLF